MTLAVLVLYLVLVLSVGLLGHRLFRGTGEDYFLASRSIGPFVLLMTLFGTHMTAFAMLGASGEAYHQGIGVFSLMASSSAFVVPVVFFFVGTRLWVLGKRHGFLTQVQFFRERWDSPSLGIGLFVLLVALLIPYLLIGVMGAGITFETITNGLVPQWLGSFLICLVVAIYVVAGGVRSTSWANTLQTLVFMTLGAVSVVIILRQLGGLDGALDSVDPAVLMHGDKIPAAKLISYTFIPLSIGMFPHIFMHWLTARRVETFKLPIVAYPICIAIVWVPSVLLGVAGSAAVPDLQGPASNAVLLRMITNFAPEVLAGLLGAGVFAAVMSSLDSQILALSTLFTQDIVRRHATRDGSDEQSIVRTGRYFVIALLAATYLLSLVSNRSIFGLGIWSFTGFASLFPIVVAALYWRRSTKQGAWAVVLTVAALWTYFLSKGWGTPGYSVAGTGIMPVAVILAAAILAMIVGSLWSPQPDPRLLNKFFSDGAAATESKL
jgi:SSS family solute:Na+ symporter